MVSPETETRHPVGRPLLQARAINSVVGIEPAVVGSNDE